MQQSLYLAAALAVGALVSTYLTLNSMVSERVGAAAQANLLYFFVAFSITAVVFLLRQPPGDLGKFAELPWWALVAGVGGAVAVFGSTFLIEEIGPDRYFVAGVAGQVIVSIVLAHFAWLGVEENAINWQKVLGALLSIGGVILVALGNAASAK